MTEGLVLLLLALFLGMAVLLEEGAAWFSRNAMDLLAGDQEDEDAARKLAEQGRESRVLARFGWGGFFTVLAVATLETQGGPWALVALGLLLPMAAASLSGAHWKSPLALAGRAVFAPLHLLGRALRWVLRGWGHLPGFDRPPGALDRLEEMDQERRWLQGETFEDTQGKMLAALHEFGESAVEDVMVPRESVAGIEAGAELPEILGIIAEQGYTRYPVYQETLDSVVGVLHLFDLLEATEGRAADFCRPAYLTNATKPAVILLRELQSTYNQMAVVLDEYGGTAGLVTVEDLLEELVGEIQDEDDDGEDRIRRLDEAAYWVDASCRVDELNELLDLHLAEGEYDTLAGLILERLQYLPRAGEQLRENGVALEVVGAEPQRITAVKLTVIDRGERSATREDA